MLDEAVDTIFVWLSQGVTFGHDELQPQNFWEVGAGMTLDDGGIPSGGA